MIPSGQRAGLAVALLALAAVGGCGPDDARQWIEPPAHLAADELATVERRIVATRWDTVFRRGGLEDGELLFPLLMVSDSSAVYVFDGADQRLLSLGRDGRTRWTFGGKGEGPNEFRAVRDMEIGPAGRIHLLDSRNRRITVVDRDGRVVRSVSVTTDAHAGQLVPLEGGRWMLVTVPIRRDRTRPLVVVDTTGEVTARRPHPWPHHAELHPMAASIRTSADPVGRHWAMGYSFGNGWFVFEGSRSSSGRRGYVEPTDFPTLLRRDRGSSFSLRIPPGTRSSARSLSARSGSLHVLFGGDGVHADRIVDRYDLHSGRYVDSYVLPIRGSTLSVGDGVFYLVRRTKVPELLALRPVP